MVMLGKRVPIYLKEPILTPKTIELNLKFKKPALFSTFAQRSLPAPPCGAHKLASHLNLPLKELWSTLEPDNKILSYKY